MSPARAGPLAAGPLLAASAPASLAPAEAAPDRSPQVTVALRNSRLVMAAPISIFHPMLGAVLAGRSRRRYRHHSVPAMTGHAPPVPATVQRASFPAHLPSACR
jgi:hypothetical protein